MKACLHFDTRIAELSWRPFVEYQELVYFPALKAF